MTWKSYRGGVGWRVLVSGEIEVEGEGIIRTGGEPKTMRHLLATHGEDLREAADTFGVPIAWIMGMIPIEAKMRPLKGGGSYPDPKSYREEPGYTSDAETPNRVSAGVMQTLLSTAQQMAAKHGYGRLRAASDLFDVQRSITLGTAYMRHQMDRYSEGVEDHAFDFVHLTGAYNAGSIKHSAESRFRLLTYSPTRTERAIRWHNDACAVLAEGCR